MPITPLPPAIFHVTPNEDIFKTQEKNIHHNSLVQRCLRVAYNILSVFIFPVGIGRLIIFTAKKITPFIVVPGLGIYDLSSKLKKLSKIKDLKSESSRDLDDKVIQIKGLHRHRDSFIANSSNRAKQLTIRTADNIDLDACEILSPDHAPGASSADQKWIVFLHGNAGCYEGHLDEFKETAANNGVNILSANYRGIMRSKGSPTSSHDLVLDGEAQVQYLLSKGVSPKNILIHGWSLGGAVGAEVAANHPGINFCSDRSFSTITEVLKGWLPRFYLGAVLGKVAYAAGWKFDSVKNFQKITGKKSIIYSKEDSIIRYSASLYKGLKEVQMTPEDRKLKIERSKLKSAPKVKNYNQDYKPKSCLRMNFGVKSRREEIINEFGQFAHTVSLHRDKRIQTRYFNQIRELLEIPVKPLHQRIYEGFRRLLAL